MKWYKRVATYVSLALSNVEKNALGQGGDDLGDNIDTVQRYRQGTLADDLLQGRVTEEVKLLRARTYKILDAAEQLKTNITATMDSDGEMVYNVSASTKKDYSRIKFKGDPFDDYKIVMVIGNDPIVASVSEAFGNIGSYENVEEVPIFIGRDAQPKLELEKYTKKMVIRDISNTSKLLEFYISKYSDDYNKKTKFLLAEIERTKSNPNASSFIDIKSVAFITYKCLGVPDLRAFDYSIDKFDKIVEHDGHYIIKFIATPVTENVNITDKYKMESLNEKYNNKERRN